MAGVDLEVAEEEFVVVVGHSGEEHTLRPDEVFAAGGQGQLGIGLGLIPFLILIVVASFLLGGREQVEAAEDEAATSRVR